MTSVCDECAAFSTFVRACCTLSKCNLIFAIQLLPNELQMEICHSRDVAPLQLGGCCKYSEKESGNKSRWLCSCKRAYTYLFLISAPLPLTTKQHNTIKWSLKNYSTHIFGMRVHSGDKINEIFYQPRVSLTFTGGGVKDMDARGARKDSFHHFSVERF